MPTPGCGFCTDDGLGKDRQIGLLLDVSHLGFSAVRCAASDVAERSAGPGELWVADNIRPAQISGDHIPGAEERKREVAQVHARPSIAGDHVAAKVESRLRCC